MSQSKLYVHAALACVLLLAACAKTQAPPQGPVEVGVVVLQPQSAVLQTELPGRTSAIETSEVRPQVNGIIIDRKFIEGGLVKRGDVLYEIDPAPYAAALAQAQAQLANARAALTTAKLKADRYADLVKINAVSRQDDDDAAGRRRARPPPACSSFRPRCRPRRSTSATPG